MLELKAAAHLLKTGFPATKVGARLARRNDDAFLAARDALSFEWCAETANKLNEFIENQMRICTLLGDDVNELRAKIEAILDDDEAELLAALYRDEAYREARAERRHMLSHAAATIVDLELSIADKCRIEKVLRDLDPSDVLELDRLARVVGYVLPLPDGRCRKYLGTANLRFVILAESRSRDALVASGCVQEREQTGLVSSDTEAETAMGNLTQRGECQFAPPWGHPFCRVMGPGGTVDATDVSMPQTGPFVEQASEPSAKRTGDVLLQGHGATRAAGWPAAVGSGRA